MMYRIFAYFCSLLFVIAIIMIALPISLFKQEKQVIHAIMLDVSQSVKIGSNDAGKIIAKFENTFSSNDAFVRGYFADKSLFLDEEIKPINNFDKKALIEEWLKSSVTFIPFLDTEITNLEFATRSAFEKWAEKGLVHIILVTDAKENSGSLINLREFLQQHGGVLTIVPILETPEDIYVKDIVLPENIVVNQTFTIETVLFATKSIPKTTLQISIGNNEKIVQEVSLKKGKNSFLFSSTVVENGIFEVSAKILENDSFPENNQLTIQAKTIEINKVLIVSESLAPTISSIAKNHNIISPIELPRDVISYLGYSAVILDDIHWKKLLDAGKMSALKEYINRGGKLFVLGGPNSFGFGDYIGTELEKLLPVKINPSGLVSLLVAIDISGSMESNVNGVRKIDIAVNSLLDISKSLEPNDELGVHLYNDKKTKQDLWIPLTLAKDFETVLNDKLKILPKPIGGTFILPALQTIYEKISSSERLLRIGVLISDGETQEKDFEEILQNFQKASPPISFIVIGADLDVNSSLVKSGKKVFGADWEPVFLDKLWNIKDSFNDALKKIASGFSDEGQFKIFANQGHPISRIIQPFEGTFNGIILKTRLKPNASTLLDINDRFPLLAHRHFGLGEVLSFQSGLYDSWAGTWFYSTQGKAFQSILHSWLVNEGNKAPKISIENTSKMYSVVVQSTLKSMEAFSAVQIKVGGLKIDCIRNSNHTWICNLNWQKINQIKTGEVYQIYCANEDGSEQMVGEGVFPPILSKEALDLYETNLLSNYFSPNDKNWRWANDKVEKVEIQGFESVSRINLFFYIALFSLLLSIFFRGRIR